MDSTREQQRKKTGLSLKPETNYKFYKVILRQFFFFVMNTIHSTKKIENNIVEWNRSQQNKRRATRIYTREKKK